MRSVRGSVALLALAAALVIVSCSSSEGDSAADETTGFPSPASCPGESDSVESNRYASEVDQSTSRSYREQQLAWAGYALDVLEGRAPSESWLLTVSFLDPKGLTDFEDAIAMLETSGMTIESLAVRELGQDDVRSYGVVAQPGTWRDSLMRRVSDQITEDQLLIAGAYGRGATEAALEISKQPDLAVAALTTRCGVLRGPDVIEPEQVLVVWERGGAGG